MFKPGSDPRAFGLEPVETAFEIFDFAVQPFDQVNRVLGMISAQVFQPCQFVLDRVRQQVDLLSDAVENELARLEDLRAYHAEDSVHLIEWLDREIEDLERRLDWLKAKRARV